MTFVSNRQLVGNCFITQGGQPGALKQPRGVGWGARWKEVSRGRDICILMAASGFPGSSAGKESACNAGDPGSISSLGRSPGEGTGSSLQDSQASLVTQTVKNPPAVQKTWIQSLGWEDPSRRVWQPTPVFLPGESPWTEEPGGVQSTAYK